jgi:hypothetical protein
MWWSSASWLTSSCLMGNISWTRFDYILKSTMPQRFHNDSTTIPHDSTPAGVLLSSQRTTESVPANMSASLPLAKTRKLHNSANSPYFGQVAVLTVAVAGTVTLTVSVSTATSHIRVCFSSRLRTLSTSQLRFSPLGAIKHH